MNNHIDYSAYSYEDIAKAVRWDIVDMIHASTMGHPGSSLSCVEMLVALYFGVMNVSPETQNDPSRDRFVFSKGHATPTLYSVLARRGFFPRETLRTFRQTDSILTAYPDMSTPGIDMEAGSLGTGISTAVGMAISSKLKGIDNRIYSIMGDGEQQEGIVWEAAMCAAHHKLNNLTAFIDRNKLQITGTTEQVMAITPLEEKWRSFGWNVICIDGHSFDQIFDALCQAREYTQGPTVIIADTVKGKGVSFMENVAKWHRSVITDDQYAQAVAEINAPEELLL